MLKLNLDLGERGYSIYIEDSFEQLGKCFSSLKSIKKCILVADSNTSKLYSQEVLDVIQKTGIECALFVIPAGEEYKTLDTIKDMYHFMLDKKLDRSSAIIALGGGVTGDMVGFAAATYLRGIHFIQIPTTLLSQADSSVGGKTGIDFGGCKNMVGAFYQPKFVYINVSTLKTLPAEELRSGMAETIKHGIIKDPDFFEYVEYNIQKILDCDTTVLQYVAKNNCSIKASVVEEDEKEHGIRAILNFGHTIGHAIESAMDFKLSHGQCVALGIIGVFKMAVKLGMTEEAILKRVENTLIRIGLPIRLPALEVDSVYDLMFNDKKSRDNKLTFVLPRTIGDVEILTINDEELIKSVLVELKEMP